MLVYDQYIYPEKPDSDDDITVFHSGFSSTQSNYSYGKDQRDYYLIHYVTKGTGIYRTEKAQYTLNEGDGFLGSLTGEVGVDGTRVDLEGVLDDGDDGGHGAEGQHDAHEQQDDIVGLGEEGLDLIQRNGGAAGLEGLRLIHRSLLSFFFL